MIHFTDIGFSDVDFRSARAVRRRWCDGTDSEFPVLQHFSFLLRLVLDMKTVKAIAPATETSLSGFLLASAGEAEAKQNLDNLFAVRPSDYVPSNIVSDEREKARAEYLASRPPRKPRHRGSSRATALQSSADSASVSPAPAPGPGAASAGAEVESTADRERVLQQTLSEAATAEENQRTLFVSNVPVSVSRKRLLQFFSATSLPKPLSVRIRSLAVDSDSKLPFKLAVQKGQLNESRKSCHAYVKYDSVEQVVQATEHFGGTVLDGQHLSVCAADDEVMDKKKSVFVGNLPLDIEDEQLWSLFDGLTVKRVRVVRDGRTGVGKGFAIVMLSSREQARKAIEKHGEEHFGRQLRVFRAMDPSQAKSFKLSAEGKNGGGGGVLKASSSGGGNGGSRTPRRPSAAPVHPHRTAVGSNSAAPPAAGSKRRSFEGHRSSPGDLPPLSKKSKKRR